MILRPLRALALSALAALAVSCDAGADCEPLECNDGVFVAAAPKGDWEIGEYELELTLDGEARSCSFSVPELSPSPVVTVKLDCGKGVAVSLSSLSDCTENSCSSDNHFELDVAIDGAPTDVRVQLTRDSELVLDDDRSVDYDDVRPRKCSAGCQQAHYALVVEP